MIISKKLKVKMVFECYLKTVEVRYDTDTFEGVVISVSGMRTELSLKEFLENKARFKSLVSMMCDQFVSQQELETIDHEVRKTLTIRG